MSAIRPVMEPGELKAKKMSKENESESVKIVSTPRAAFSLEFHMAASVFIPDRNIWEKMMAQTNNSSEGEGNFTTSTEDIQYHLDNLTTVESAEPVNLIFQSVLDGVADKSSEVNFYTV